MYSVMAKEIPASPICDMMVRASAMEDIVSFAVGDPDFPSDDCIIEAAKASLDRRETNCAPGAGVPVSMDVRETDDFELTADTVERVITDRTHVLMLNSPCNPTGGILTRGTLARISALARAHDLFVMSDEVYRHILFDGAQYVSIASEPGMAERTMIMDSCSRTFAMTGSASASTRDRRR